MAMNSAIHDQAYPFFLEEAPELLQTIESGLLTLSEGKDTSQIHAIMRAAHSLKGGAASVGLEAIKTLAHRLETIFKSLYSDRIELDGELENQLLAAFDCLRLPLTEQFNQGYFDAPSALAQAEPIFSALEQRLEAAIAETENYIPSSSDLGLDMATSIFEVDVQQGLEHLDQVLANPAAYEVAGELRAQVEVFIGFAELLELSGFGQIAETTLQALDTCPDQALAIAQLAVEDFRAGRDGVLTGSDASGGAPSASLQELARGAAPAPAEITQPDSTQPDSAQPVPVAWSAPLHGAADPLDLGEPMSDEEALALLAQSDAEAAEMATEAAASTDPFEPPAAPAEAEPAAAKASEETQTSGLAGLFSDVDAIAPAAEPPTPQPEPTPATVTTAVSTTEEPPAPSSSQPQPAPRRMAPGMTVRVDAERLSRLDNYLGELTINRNGLALQKDQLRLGIKDLLSRFERVRGTIEQLQSTSNQLLIAPDRQKSTPDASPRSPEEWLETDFDSLEMDTYTSLYNHCQTLLEDMLQLEEAVEDISLFNQQADQLLGQHGKMLSQMQDEVRWARMVPLSNATSRFPRMIRDLANTYQKPTELVLEGTELLVEKAVLEKLHDPLMHLLRNGFDHGLEDPATRRRLGKPETGRIQIRAEYRGRQVVIEVSDDGGGLDLERVRQRVVQLGWLTPEEAASQSTDRLSRLIFEPGFSTASQVSELSGRGVGLDVVKEQIQLLKGTISVESKAGQGTRFILSLPMTLSIVNLLICFAGATPIAFRSDSITEMLVPQPHQLVSRQGQMSLQWQEKWVPLYRLSDLLSYHCLVPERPMSRVLAAVPAPSDWESPVLILTRGDQTFAFQVDRLVTEQESVIKPFGPALTPPGYAYGCTVLGDGSFIPVVDGQVFLDDLLSRGESDSTAEATDVLAAVAEENSDRNLPQNRMQQATTVLVVDDALTSRRTLALSLERTGYRVLQARDGQEALEQLEQNTAVQLVICDIEMPVMNGFEFLTQRRQSPQLTQIPTVMLTSRGNDKHRRLAMHLGANDYFTKPYLEQEFLKAIAAYIKAPEPAAMIGEPS